MQVWQNYSRSNKHPQAVGPFPKFNVFEAFVPNTTSETHTGTSLNLSVCLSLSLPFAGNLPCILWLKVRCSAWDAGVGVHIKAGGAAASSRLHTGAMFLWTLALAVMGFLAQHHLLPRCTEKRKKSEEVENFSSTDSVENNSGLWRSAGSWRPECVGLTIDVFPSTHWLQVSHEKRLMEISHKRFHARLRCFTPSLFKISSDIMNI